MKISLNELKKLVREEAQRLFERSEETKNVTKFYVNLQRGGVTYACNSLYDSVQKSELTRDEFKACMDVLVKHSKGQAKL